ncbi:MAG: ATP-binding protein, partial [Bacteroidota bacterium]
MGIRSQILFFLILISVSSLLAQTEFIPERLTIEDGLTQGYVSKLHQDQEGFIWLSTKNGLNRYDGERFEVFTQDPTDEYSISHNWVTQIFEYKDYLLIGTKGGGMNIFHKKTQKFYKVPQTNPAIKSWANMDIEDLVVDSIGNIWVVENVTGLFLKLELPKNFWERLPLEEEILSEVKIKTIPDLLSVLLITKMDDKYLYLVVATYQLLRLDIHTLEWERLGAPLIDSSINVFAQDIKNGFAYFPNKEKKIRFFRDNRWLTIPTDFTLSYFYYNENKNQLWVGSFGELLFFDQWTPREKMLRRKNASMVIPARKETFLDLIYDQSGNVWVATSGYGVMKIAPRNLKIKTYFSGESIYSRPYLSKDGKIITTGAWERHFSNQSQITKALNAVWWLEDNKGSLWLVGKNGSTPEVYQLSESGQLERKVVLDEEIPENHTAMMDKATNTIWVASPSGHLIKYEIITDQLERYSFKKLFQTGIRESDLEELTYSLYDCYSLVRTANQHWWIGTSKGLVHATPINDNYEFELIKVKEGNVKGLLNNDVASLLIDPKDNNMLWIGTKGGGMHRLDTRNMTFTHINTTTHGLPNDVIYGVLSDDEANLWMSSNKGIIKYNPNNGEIKNFTEADGMQSDEFNTWAYAKASTGEMLFGGINGLNIFHPKDLKDNEQVPKVWITGLTVNNQPTYIRDSSQLLNQSIEYTSNITLPFEQNSITLEFAALEFSAPFKNQFKYYLEGAELEWAHLSVENKANYLNIDPGSYTFKIKGANGDGIWSEQIRELKITILPPWYRSNLAYLTYLILVGLGIWQVLKFQQRRLNLRYKIEQEQKEKERLKELDRAKSRFYTNITHEFRTPLTVISGLVDQLDNTNSIKEPIQRNSNQLLNLVNQILDLRKLESGDMSIRYTQGDIIRYLRYLMESFQSYAHSIGITFHFLAEEESFIMDFDKEKITRIFSNLISNAIKFTPEGGNVYLRINIQDHLFSFEIKDTGKGIPKEELPHIFGRFYQVDDTATRQEEGTGVGLTLVKELITAMEGDIQVSSIQGKGATFTVTLPITRKAPMDEDEQHFQNIFIPRKITEKEKAALTATAHSETTPTEKPTILLIEDNADVIHYLIKCLQENYQLEIAMNGEEGIDKAIEHTPDLIISDVMMPK